MTSLFESTYRTVYEYVERYKIGAICISICIGMVMEDILDPVIYTSGVLIIIIAFIKKSPSFLLYIGFLLFGSFVMSLQSFKLNNYDKDLVELIGEKLRVVSMCEKQDNRDYVCRVEKVIDLEDDSTIYTRSSPNRLLLSKSDIPMMIDYDINHNSNSFSSLTIDGVLDDIKSDDIHRYTKSVPSIRRLTLNSIEVIENRDLGNMQSISNKLLTSKMILTKRAGRQLPLELSGLLSGIIYGGTEQSLKGISDELRITGTTHIVAVSGYNVTLLLNTLLCLSTILGRKRVLGLSIFIIMLFMVFVGIDNIPVVRSGMMSLCSVFAHLLGRKRSLNIFLPFVVCLMLLVEPYIYKSISFQLSFVSTLGLIFLSERISKHLEWVPNFIKEDASSTIAAIVSTFPVTIINFGQFSIISLVVNVLVLNVVSIISVVGLFYFIFLALIPNLAQIMSFLLWPLLKYVVEIIKFFGRLEWVLIEV